MRVDLFSGRMVRRYKASRFRMNTFIIVSHGITIRAFIMRWFHLDPLWYEKSQNHPNCSVYEICGGEHKFIFGGFNKEGEIVTAKDLNQAEVDKEEVSYSYVVSEFDIRV